MKRIFDASLALLALICLAPLMLIVGLAVKWSSPGPVLHWSQRIGKDNRSFSMPKFRTMRIGTPVLATHLLEGPHQWLTPIGAFLRRTSIDELPQLWSVLVGHMSLVGPRPALFNQPDLIEMRTQLGIGRLRPGITGWAQVNGRDDLTDEQKVQLDEHYLEKRSFLFDLKIIFKTGLIVMTGKGVRH